MHKIAETALTAVQIIVEKRHGANLARSARLELEKVISKDRIAVNQKIRRPLKVMEKRGGIRAMFRRSRERRSIE